MSYVSAVKMVQQEYWYAKILMWSIVSAPVASTYIVQAWLALHSAL